MLLRTILLPSVLESIPEDELAQKLFCNSQIQLLRDLTENCVVFVDSNHAIKNEIMASISKWPIKFRPRAQELFKKLSQKNRFVTPSIAYTRHEQCNFETCKDCIGMALSCFPNAILVNDKCFTCVKNHNLNIRPIDVSEYVMSSFFQQRYKLTTITLNNGEWDQEKFEDTILRPLFRDSKHIKIYDRMIGRSTGEKVAKEEAVIPENYEKTLEWIVQIFLEESSHKKGRVFEIYSGIDVRFLQLNEINDTCELLHQFETYIKEKYNFPNFKLTLKAENRHNKESTQEETDSKYKEMPHARYLITDQIGILIERGCHLLWNDKQMVKAKLDPNVSTRLINDVTISRIFEPHKIETAVKKLSDL